MENVTQSPHLTVFVTADERTEGSLLPHKPRWIHRSEVFAHHHALYLEESADSVGVYNLWLTCHRMLNQGLGEILKLNVDTTIERDQVTMKHTPT